jgi:hypothetical protein
MMRRVPVLVAVAASLALAACGGTTPSEEHVNPTPSPTAAPSDSVAPSAGASAEATALEPSATSLPPGRYTREGFAPPITLALDEGWRAVQLFDGFFDVQQDVGSPHVIAIQFANVRGVHGSNNWSEDVTDAAAAVETLGAHPGLDVVESSESRIGGFTGQQITVENAGSAHAEVIDVPPGPLGIDPDRRLWIAFFDTDDGLLAIMVGGSVERWDEALAAAEPVLESVEIGAGP